MKKFKTSGIFLLLLILILIPLLGQSQFDKFLPPDFVQGKQDAAKDAKGNVLWTLGGCLLGPLGVFMCYLKPSPPPPENLMGKSDDYVRGYTDAYRPKKNARDAAWAWAGMAGCYGITALLWFVE
jgi:hypothetical protein